MDLTKHRSEFLAIGWHRVKIKSVRDISSPKNEGYEYRYEDASGREGKDAFWLSDAALWVLANFCECLGMTTKEMEDFKKDMPIGRKAWARIEKNSKYHETAEWAPDSEQAPTHGGSKTEEKTRAFETTTSTDGTGPVDDDDPDIPF